MAPPFKVKAVFDYASGHDDDLNFPNGQIITVTEEEDQDWYVGEYLNASGVKQEGLFPRNFVERYEPEAPPRPTRARPKKDNSEETPEAAPAMPVPISSPEPTIAEPDPEQAAAAPSTPIATKVEPVPTAKPIAPPAQKEEVPPPPIAVSTSKTSPPAVAEKPSSFRDRIAAFNKGAAPPLAPVKPGNLSSGSNAFVKKPFVAAPPARDSYVPPPKEVTPKMYKREEDPEIAEQQRIDREIAENAGMAEHTEASVEGENEGEAPKAMSMKERIAMIQKQQQEAANRFADASSKKRQKKQNDDNEALADEIDVLSLHNPITEGSASAAPKQLVAEKRISSGPGHSEGLSDGNEADQSGAGDETEDGDAESTEVEEADARQPPKPLSRVSTALSRQVDVEKDNEDLDEDESEEESDEDEETKKKRELRERMARVSGGRGMPGMFVMPQGPAAAPRKKKPSADNQEANKDEGNSLPQPRMILPGISASSVPRTHSLEATPLAIPAATDQPLQAEAGSPPAVTSRTGTSERPIPPHGMSTLHSQLTSERAAPPAPPSAPRGAPPVPGNHPVPLEIQDVSSRQSAQTRSSIGSEAEILRNVSAVPDTPKSTAPQKLASREVPPIPSSLPVTVSKPDGDGRPLPPPPPINDPPSRQSTLTKATDDSTDAQGESEYEGDYDTDIASGATHRNALNKVQDRDPSADESPDLPPQPTRPPVPTAPIVSPPIAQRAAPPPPPHAMPSEKSPNSPRAPPPVPPHRQVPDDYDPYRYPAPSQGLSSPTNPRPTPIDHSSEALGADVAHERVTPAPIRQSRDMTRASNDHPRQSTVVRRSTDQARSSTEFNQLAQDVDLAERTQWWALPNTPPPVFQNRVDVRCEYEETSASKRGGRTTLSRDVYVLFQDYSQTVVSAQFDSKDPAEVVLDQRHEPPPHRLSQDQLEAVHNRIGSQISTVAASKVGQTIGDGSATALVLDILNSQPNVLLPVGTRAYGALVYANMANATTQQYDEIRPGDVITFRNAKFSGKHGAMHAKYTEDVGKPEHAGIVVEWDGSKRKVRALEQGRDSKKSRVEGFRIGDLRSGEVRVWRVMDRKWVGWE